jgi:hypothetical protein
MAEDSYEEIEPIIERWVLRHQFTLFTRAEGIDGQFRVVYVSSDSECCQIWVDPPSPHGLGVHAAGVETRDDEEMRRDWYPALPQLGSVLDEAVAYVHRWFERHN